MPQLVALSLIALLTAPGVSEPERALQAIVANLRRQEFLAAWDQIAPDTQKKLERSLRSELKAEPKADVRELIEAWVAEQRKNPQSPVAAIGTLKVVVEKVEQDGDSATIVAIAAVGGLPVRGVITMTRIGQTWMLADIRKSTGKTEAAGPVGKAANEKVAMATLRKILIAQAHFQATGLVDRNADGTGEYGTLAEMSAAVVPRGAKNKIFPSVLVPEFQKLQAGRFTRGGYHFRVYLPGAKGIAINEKDGTDKVDARLSEVVWCAYAWPVKAGETGDRAFFVNQMGDVLTTKAQDHEGAKGYDGDTEPSPYAVFTPDADGKPATSITTDAAIATKATDGSIWTAAR